MEEVDVGINLDVTDEESPEVSFEIYHLNHDGFYVEALKEQAKILQRRKDNCESSIVGNDLEAVAKIAENGKIYLKVPKLQDKNTNDVWTVVDKVLESIDKLNIKLDELDDESPEVSYDIYKLYDKGLYIEALKEQAKILRRRRGNCASWSAGNDLDAVAWIVQDGEINLKVPELFTLVPINVNAIWRLVDKVVEAIDNLDKSKN